MEKNSEVIPQIEKLKFFNEIMCKKDLKSIYESQKGFITFVVESVLQHLNNNNPLFNYFTGNYEKSNNYFESLLEAAKKTQSSNTSENISDEPDYQNINNDFEKYINEYDFFAICDDCETKLKQLLPKPESNELLI